MDFYLITRLAAFAYDRGISLIEASLVPALKSHLHLTWRACGWSHEDYLSL